MTDLPSDSAGKGRFTMNWSAARISWRIQACATAGNGVVLHPLGIKPSFVLYLLAQGPSSVQLRLRVSRKNKCHALASSEFDAGGSGKQVVFPIVEPARD